MASPIEQMLHEALEAGDITPDDAAEVAKFRAFLSQMKSRHLREMAHDPEWREYMGLPPLDAQGED